jgi:hypothetical protein
LRFFPCLSVFPLKKKNCTPLEKNEFMFYINCSSKT